MKAVPSVPERFEVLRAHEMGASVRPYSALSVTEFFDLVSHKLAQPLTSVRCCLELVLQQTPVRGSQHERMAMAVDEIERAAHVLGVVHRLLEAEAPAQSANTTDVAGIVRECVEDLLPLAEEKHVGLKFDCGTCALVNVDAQRLRQALWNVLENCIQSSFSGGEVRIGCTSGPDGIALEICDASIVTVAELRAVFDGFSSTVNRSTGEPVSCLSMAIAKAHLEALGAVVQVWVGTISERCMRISFPRMGRKQ
jgi:two-component system OmpR family sensor kinase